MEKLPHILLDILLLFITWYVDEYKEKHKALAIDESGKDDENDKDKDATNVPSSDNKD